MPDNVRRFVDTLSKTKLECGKSVIELTTYKGTELWWFVDRYFYLFIKNIISGGFKKESTRISILGFYENIVHFLDFLVLIFLKVLFLIFKTRNEENITILFTAQNLEWKTIKDKYGNLKKSDAFFDSILKNLMAKKISKFVGTYPLIPKRTSLMEYIKNIEVLVDKMKNWDITHIPYEYYLSSNIIKDGMEATKVFREIWAKIENDKTMVKLCQYQDYNLNAYVKKELKKYFFIYFPFAIKYIKMGIEMIEREKPRLVILVNEYGLFERAVVTACKMKKIPTVAIQHGMITPTHYGYIYGKEDKGRILLPDITCVYGKYHHVLLTEKSIYAPSKVIVTGSPRYDALFHVNRIYRKEEFVNKFKVNKDSRIILWTTQCHGLTYKENLKNFSMVFQVIRDISGLTLIIKQHPGESDRHTDMIKDFIKKYNLNNIILVPKDYDTYELLFVCDLMITKTSTTAVEAIALNKPVIELNLGDEPDVVEYVEEGVALGVYDPEDLKEAIKKLLEDDSDLAKNREKYILKYLHKIDGKASERAAELIKRMM